MEFHAQTNRTGKLLASLKNRSEKCINIITDIFLCFLGIFNIQNQL